MSSGTLPVCRAVRLVAIRDLVTTQPITPGALARRFGVHERTIYRDLQDLQLAPLCCEIRCVQLWASPDVLSNLGHDLSL
jgi:hypothetical protein